MTEIKNERPPNFKSILEVFSSAKNHGVIFAYAPYIYNPSGVELPPEIIAHEQVHIARQQETSPENWWALYLTNPIFRYEEELLAHRAEYKKLCELAPSRQVRRGALKTVAKKLIAPLYAYKVPLSLAMEDLAA